MNEHHVNIKKNSSLALKRASAARKKYRIAIYIRLSVEDMDIGISEEKRESYSVSNQRDYIRNYLEHKVEFRNAVIDEFVDDGYSGTNFERPGIKALLLQCRQGDIDCIVVKDLSRFGRNYLEVGDYLEQIFPFLGIRFIAINDGVDSNDYIGQTSGIDVAFKNFIYEMYSRDLSQKIKSGVDTCMKRGEYHAGWIVYGYEKSLDGRSICVDKGAADLVRRIFQEMASGKAAGQIAKELNAEGIPTRLAYKQKKGEQLHRNYGTDIWNHNQIYSIIHNEVYQGDMIYRKTVRLQMGKNTKRKQSKEKWIVIQNHHEAIVNRELFARANKNIHSDRIAEQNRNNAKRGVFFCGCCGNRLELRKTKAPYYQCKRKNFIKESECNVLKISKNAVEDAVWKVWQEHCERFSTVNLWEIYARQLEQIMWNLKDMDRHLERFPSEKLNLYERFRRAGLALEVFLKEREILEKNEEKVRSEIEELSKRAEALEQRIRSCESVAAFVKKYSNFEGGIDELMKKMVEKVKVFKHDRVEVVWRYQDEFQMVKR